MNWRDVTEAPDAINWLIGRYVNPAWNEDLPTRLYLDAAGIRRIAGHPLLFNWRADVIDLIALPVGGVRKVATELGLSVAVAIALNELVRTVARVTREDDEVLTPGYKSPIWWLSWEKCQKLGYVNHYVDSSGRHFLTRTAI